MELKDHLIPALLQWGMLSLSIIYIIYIYNSISLYNCFYSYYLTDLNAGQPDCVTVTSVGICRVLFSFTLLQYLKFEATFGHLY